MPEPFNPQDHTLGKNGEAPALYCIVDESVWTPKIEAIVEAIHQTFERDASNQAASEAYSVELAAYKSDPRSEPSGSPYKVGEGRETLLQPDPPHTADDPDTEIDRLARLIVDGEYRRRSAQDA